MNQRASTLVLLATLVAGGVPAATAVPILGGQLFYAGGEVTVTSLPVTSGFTSELGLYDETFTRLVFLLLDEPAGEVETFDPSAFGIGVGDELVFGIRIVGDGTEYFMGPASRNPDGVIHAQVESLGGGMFEVGFEDLFGGGDLDYDDNRFLFEGGIRPSEVPAPATLALVGFVLVAFAGRLAMLR